MFRRYAVSTFVGIVAWLALLRGCWNGTALSKSLAAYGSTGAVGATVADAATLARSDDSPRTALLIPARVRRLSNTEYDASVAALLGSKLAPGRSFAPDARQAGFTENEAQRVDSVLAKQLFAAAQKLAAEARPHLADIAPCATPADREACARAFIADLGARAYRRPLTAAESSSLLELFRAGALDSSYESGIELVIRGLLQSAGFLYLTELGDSAPDASGAVTLTGHELASSLSYLMTGAPPDRALREAAAAGQLSSAAARRSQLQRLRREQPASRDQLVRMLREWLQLDPIENTAKDAAIYPQYELYRKFFIAESQAFIAAVLDQNPKDSSDLSALLGADWTVGDHTLAQFYDAHEFLAGRLQLPARRGILNQGAFLAVEAHARQSAPVLRGALIARRLACIPVPAPETRGLKVLPPPPDPKLTTRQRYELHATNPLCAECHDKIDDFGNAFEQYDGMGALRHSENGSELDTSASVAVGADFDGAYADSNALALALAASPSVRECFARYMFRAAAARSVDHDGAPDTTASEEAFIDEWRELPETERGNVMDTLAVFVSSRLFTQRRAL
jgi:hypothetical protein